MLLNGLLDYSFRERSVRATREKKLVKQILGGWECFRSWWDGPSATPETKTATILLLSKLLQVCWSWNLQSGQNLMPPTLFLTLSSPD